MAVVFLTNGSTSPWSRPGNFSDSGHLVEMIGAGGRGGITATGTSFRSGSGGGGGGYVKLTRSGGTIPSNADFFVGADTASGTSTVTTNATKWGQATLAAPTNCRYIQAGSFGASATSGGAGGNATTTTAGTPTISTYSTTTNTSGGAGGATSAVLGSAGGGGSAASTDGAGSVGGACTTASFGGGGGAAVGASNNGAAASSANGGDGGLFAGAAAAGGTNASKQGAQGDQANGNGAGGGFFSTVVGNLSGGLGGKRTVPWTQTSDSATAGGGAGGGGAGACSLNSSGATTNGGNGGVYGGGGGGAGGTRSTTSTRTPGTGASGIIVITYTGAVTDSVDETVSSTADTESATTAFGNTGTETAATSESMSGIKTNLVRIFGGYPFLNTDGTNWAGLTLRVRFEPSMLAANNGGNERVTFDFLAGTSGVIAAAYIGHAAASGDAYDFDGNQVQLTFFGGSTSWSVSGASSISSDYASSFAYDPTRALIISVAFTGTTINLAGF